MSRASLNHAYRLVWSDVTQSYVAVSENTRSRGKRSALAVALTLALGSNFAAAQTTINADASNVMVTQNEDVTVNAGVTVTGDLPVGLDTGDYTATFTNNGTLRAENTGSAAALAAFSDIRGSLINAATGAISATVVSSSSGQAAGIAGRALTGTLVNGNTINASLAAEGEGVAHGILLDRGIAGTGTLNNTGTIGATVTTNGTEGEASGIHIYGDIDGTLVNAKNINASIVGSAGGVRANGVYVDGKLNGSLSNTATGVINVSSTGYQAAALGILVNNDSVSSPVAAATLVNGGTIAVTTSGVRGAQAAGMYFNGDADASIINSGSITATASATGSPNSGENSAGGIVITGSLNGDLNNSGTLTATATGVAAEAGGIRINGAMVGNLTNTRTGVISATSVDGGEGVSVFGNVAGAFNNEGTINMSTVDVGEGVYVGGSISGTFVNAGSINFTGANGGEGVYVQNEVLGIFKNSGSIIAKGYNENGATAVTGVFASKLPGKLENSGLISAAATTTAATDASRATGLQISSLTGGTVDNSGTISASAQSRGEAHTLSLQLDDGTGAIKNSGVISAVATASESQGTSHAAGVIIMSSNGVTVDNSGTIRASAQSEAIASAGAMTLNGADGTIRNSGLITAEATATGSQGESYATALQVTTMNGGTIDNSGTIHASSRSGADAYATSISVNAGTGTIRNQAGGRMIGGLRINGSDIAVENAGEIILKNGVDLNAVRNTGTAVTGRIAGSYTQTATGVLHIAAQSNLPEIMEVDQNGVETITRNAGYSQLKVDGNASIAGTAFVDVKSANTLAVGQKLAGVVEAGKLDGNFSSVADNSLMFNFKSIVNGNAIDLETVKGTSATEAVNRTGNNPGRGAAGVIDRIVDAGTQSSDMQTVIDALGKLETQEQVSNAISQLLPLISGSMTQATRGAVGGVGQIVQVRQEGQTGRSSGDGFLADRNVWFKPFGSWADQDTRQGVSGYKSDTYGFVMGADGELSNATRIGLAFSYAKSDVDGKSSVARNSADIDSYQLVGYGSYRLSDVSDLRFQAGLGVHDNKGRRQVQFGGLDRTARADYDSLSANVGVAYARTYAISERTSITPLLRADYTMIDEDSYRERGADALNLRVGGHKTEAFVVGVDGKLTHALSERATLTASLGVGYDMINERSSITSAFAGEPTASFTTRGIDPSPWLTRGGFGLVGKVSDNLEISARYDFEVRESFKNQTASVKARWSF